ncbi:MAG: glycosyltransferase family 4 protein, partial [Bacteroidales bacterium]|nr:glycosyltransferase family 4 protein [Bacteroidales bacterium]
LIAINPSREWVDEDVLPAEFRERTKFRSVSVDTRIKPFKAFFNLLGNQSYFIQRFYSRDFREKLIEIFQNETYDIIQLEHLYLCIYIDTIRKHTNAKIVLRPQNVEFEVWEGYLKNMTNPFKRIYIQVATKRLKKFEATIVSEVDGIIAITPKDADVFKRYTDKVPVIDIPVSFNYQLLESCDFEKQYTKFPSVYHLGSMDWRPNEEAVSWFLKKIYPQLIKEIPEIKIYLAGKKMQPYFKKQSNNNLLVEGMVENALVYQEDKAILIVPLLSGSGIRAKIIEGMALGKTIISTSTGAQGINCINEKNILIADTPDEFVHQIKRCVESEQFCRKNLLLKTFIIKHVLKECSNFIKPWLNI